MRIAYQLAGHLRSFRDNRTVVANLLSRYPGDVFVYTYAVRELPDGAQAWHLDRTVGGDVTPEDEAWIRAHYPGVRVFVIDPAKCGGEYMPAGCEKMGYRHSLEQVHTYRRRWQFLHGAEYDCVFNARFDLVLHEPMLLRRPEPGVVYGGLNLNQQERGLDGEVFTYGRPEVMDAMHVPGIPPGAEKDIPEFGFVGEALFTAIRLSHGFKYEAHKTRYGLLRNWGVMDVRT